MKDKGIALIASIGLTAIGFLIRWIGLLLYESGASRHYVGFPLYGYMYDYDSIGCVIGVLIKWSGWLVIIVGIISILVSLFSKS